ncbi:PREDICTED: coiled-coil domain-containing protein C1orf110 homolog [Myotis brandtii]|uniref:coiled-coil domain-containing protein C1orf110 homolog n=1 Tax=Myotis brandtii TaxID=109478 RepID=UPI00070457A0|nr:PREDICTED: coiled-coil domain-containing protein C1orf110 homolog [Myotis brandtii]
MKGTERHMARRPLHKQLDLERKHAKQAEARLSQHLQRLEQAHLCHLKLLAWEQRQLQKQLQRLQQADRKGKCPSSPGNRVQQRPGGAPVRPQQGGNLPLLTPPRALAINTAQEAHGARPQGPPSCHNGLESPTRSKEQSPPQSQVTSPLPGEMEPVSPGAPSFREVLARAANAHYLRHRVPPEAERLLSMGEIFGHGGPRTQRRAPGGHLSDPPEPSE